MRRYWLIPVLLCLVAAGDSPTSRTSADSLERSRRMLDDWRTDPEHYARLQRDLHDFWSLPRERRRRLRQLDRELHTADGRRKERLWGVLARYYLWLEGLPEADRQRLAASSDRKEKLHLIREIKERQWVERLPRKARDELLKLPPEKRPAEIARLRREEKQLRADAQRPPRTRPANLNQLPADVQAFVRESLLPQLTPEERKRLHAAGGSPVTFLRTLVELSESHPVLPPLPSGPVKSYKDLPAEARRLLPRDRLQSTGKWKALRQAEGKWPDYALAFLEVARQEQKRLTRPLGASRPREFPPEIQSFINQKLRLRLGPGEEQRLIRTEGKWPEYPRLLLQLARKHRLSVPGMSLPLTPDLWDAALSRGP